MNYKIGSSAFIASVIISAVFLGYAGDLYYKTCCLTYGLRVSVQASDIEQSASGMVLKSAFLLENPSSLDFKVTYVREEVYDDSDFEASLGDTYKSTSPGAYLALVKGFSNATIDLTVSLARVPSSENLFVKVYMRFVDVPLLGSLYLTRYFSLPLNVSSEEGAH
jgi:outer membrane protein assembly factor BamA